MGSGFCDFCQVWHSAGCCHPGRIILAAKEAELTQLRGLLRKSVGFVKYFPLAHCGLKTEEGLRFTNLCGLVISKEVKDKAQGFLDKDEIKALMKEGPDADK